MASENTDKQELRRLADNLPFEVVLLPEFEREGFEPEQVRQPRRYKALSGDVQAISRFLMERGTVDILSPEQTHALFTEMHWCGYRIHALAGQAYPDGVALRAAVVQARRLVSQIEAAEEELFIANRLLVVSCVKPFFWIGPVWMGDFLQEGSRALSNAIRKFNVSRGTPFYAYAQRAIQNRLRNYLRDHVRAGSIGIRPTEEMMRIMEAIQELTDRNQVEPDNEAIAEWAGMDATRVAKIRPFVKQWERTPAPPLSLDALLSDTDISLYDFVQESDSETALNALEKSEVWQAIERLPERDRQVMRYRFIEGRTLEETGQLLNLTRARIKQIEDASLKKVRYTLRQQENG